MKKFMDYAIRNWGFENAYTIELFKMIENGETAKIIQQYIDLADGAMAEDWGFEM